MSEDSARLLREVVLRNHASEHKELRLHHEEDGEVALEANHAGEPDERPEGETPED